MVKVENKKTRYYLDDNEIKKIKIYCIKKGISVCRGLESTIGVSRTYISLVMNKKVAISKKTYNKFKKVIDYYGN